MKSIKFLSFLPLILILVFISITYKSLLEGYKFQRHDKIQYSYIGKQRKEFIKKYGKEPLWYSSVFSGTPDPITTYFSGEYLSEFTSFLRRLLTTPIAVHLLAALGVFLGILLISNKPWIATLSATAYSLSGFHVISIIAGHDLKLVAIAYVPFIVFGAFHVFKGRFIWGCIMYLFGLSLQLGSRHYQIVYYTILLLLLFGLVETIFTIKNKKDIKLLIKKTIVLSLISFFSILPNVGKVWYTMEYTPFSIRGGTELVDDNAKTEEASDNKSDGLSMDYAFKGWSYKIQESLSLFVPNLYGGASFDTFDKKSETYQFLKSNNALQNLNYFPTYWGGMRFTAGPNYLGASFIVLFIFSIFFLRLESRIWLLSSFTFFLILTWGDNFFLNELLFKYLPAYNKFRTPSMAVTSMSIIMSLSVGMGFINFFNTDLGKLSKNKMNIVLLCIGAPFLLALFFMWNSDFLSTREIELGKGGNIPEALFDAIANDRKKLLSKDLFRSFFFVAIALLPIYYYIKKKISAKYVMIGLVAVVFIDLYSFNDRYLSKPNVFVKNREKAQTNFTPTVADQMILKDTSYYRVFDVSNSPFNDARVSCFHNSIGGYSALKMQRYQEIIENYLGKSHKGVLDMLNAKYLITGNPKQPVFLRPSASGAAWLVSSVKQVNNANQELEALNSLDMKQSAVVDVEKFPLKNTRFSTENSSIALVYNNTQKLIYKANLSHNALALFSEVYYPKGWEITVNGKPQKAIRANYILRALELPQGEHEIVFEFKPKPYVLGNKISYAGSTIVLLLFLILSFMLIKKKEIKLS